MRNWGVGMIVAAWLMLGGVVWLFMDGWVSRQTQPNAHLAELPPGAAVVLRRNASGHYVAPGRINGVPVTLLVDTGATAVALPAQVARRVGAPAGQPLRTATAAGTTTAYATRLASVELGGLTAEDVGGVIVPDMPGETVLLGMSFLARFSLRMEGGELHIAEHAPTHRP
ncbi:MAG: TIGR02281 family clan AA aspartic protease [Thiobacillaceae bacterium]|nr:TIGR02281 family clan AA aspartic protease [Thiobacillaceae bacterium]MDW8324255.1 TIGR02281 family clan AA aspartic protease [Burkholderiales bacterium]